MDKTQVYIDMPGKRTLHFKGPKTVDVAQTGQNLKQPYLYTNLRLLFGDRDQII